MIKSGNMTLVSATPTTITIRFSLSVYPNGSTTTQDVAVTFKDPCTKTILDFPSGNIQNVGYTLFDPRWEKQILLPALDTVTEAAVYGKRADLCGPRVYTLNEEGSWGDPNLVYSIVPPDSSADIMANYTTNWTLAAYSENWSHSGYIRIYYRASLQNYPSIQAQSSKYFHARVLHPCSKTTITPPVINNMRVSMYSSTPTLQRFSPSNDTVGVQFDNPDQCGDKTYVSDKDIITITSPPAGQKQLDKWNITSVYDASKSYTLGFHNVTITVTVPTPNDNNNIAPQTVSVTFTVELYNDCGGTTITSDNQVIKDLYFIVLENISPVFSTFKPFSDGVAKQYNDTDICGPKVYSIVESRPFLSIMQPASGLVYSDPWTIALMTNSLNYVGLYSTTIKAVFQNYPDVAAGTAKFNVNIAHPCTLTELEGVSLVSMTFKQGKKIVPVAATQTFSQLKDTKANELKNATFCGEREYTITSASYISLWVPSDPWQMAFTINVWNNEPALMGTFPMEVTCYLKDYPEVKPKILEFQVILITDNNTPPIFKPELKKSATVQMTNEWKSFTFEVPSTYDDEGDTVQMKVDFGYAGNFAKLDSNDNIYIEDISREGNCRAGMFFIKFELSDGKDSSTFTFALFVLAPPPLPPPPPKPEPVLAPNTTTAVSEGNSTAASNSTDNSTASSSNSTDNSITEGNSTESDGSTASDSNETDSGSNQTANSSKSGGSGTPKKREDVITLVSEDGTVYEEVIEPIELEVQEKVTFVPAQVKAFMDQLLSAPPPSVDALLDQATRAKTQCIPGESKVSIQDSLASVELIFFNVVSFPRSDQLINEIKRTGSIQFFLLKADPTFDSSEFEWTMVRGKDEHTIVVQVNFTMPETISASTEGKDRLRILFKNPSKFITCPFIDDPNQGRELRTFGKSMPSNFDFLVELPVMYTTEFTKAFDAVVNNPGNSATMVISSIIINYAAGLSANLLWGGINSLQLIASISLYKIIVPPNSLPLVQLLQTLVTFDMIFMIWDPINHLPFTDTPAYNDNFCLIDYCTLGFYDALGSMAVIIFGTGLIWVSVPAIIFLAERYGWDQQKCCKKLRKRQGAFAQTKQSVSNSVIRLVLESYLTLLISIGVNIYYGNFVRRLGGLNIYDMVNYGSGIIATVFTALFTLAVFYIILWEYPRTLERSETLDKLKEKQPIIEYYERLRDERIKARNQQLALHKKYLENLQRRNELAAKEFSSEDTEEIETRNRLEYWRNYTLEHPLKTTHAPQFEGGSSERSRSLPQQSPREDSRPSQVYNRSPPSHKSPDGTPFRRRPNRRELDDFIDDARDWHNPSMAGAHCRQTKPRHNKMDFPINDLEQELRNVQSKIREIEDKKEQASRQATKLEGVNTRLEELSFEEMESEVNQMTERLKQMESGRKPESNKNPLDSKNQTGQSHLTRQIEDEMKILQKELERSQKSKEQQAKKMQNSARETKTEIKRPDAAIMFGLTSQMKPQGSQMSFNRRMSPEQQAEMASFIFQPKLTRAEQEGRGMNNMGASYSPRGFPKIGRYDQSHLSPGSESEHSPRLVCESHTLSSVSIAHNHDHDGKTVQKADMVVTAKFAKAHHVSFNQQIESGSPKKSHMQLKEETLKTPPFLKSPPAESVKTVSKPQSVKPERPQTQFEPYHQDSLPTFGQGTEQVETHAEQQTEMSEETDEEQNEVQLIRFAERSKPTTSMKTYAGSKQEKQLDAADFYPQQSTKLVKRQVKSVPEHTVESSAPSSAQLPLSDGAEEKTSSKGQSSHPSQAGLTQNTAQFWQAYQTLPSLLKEGGHPSTGQSRRTDTKGQPRQTGWAGILREVKEVEQNWELVQDLGEEQSDLEAQQREEPQPQHEQLVESLPPANDSLEFSSSPGVTDMINQELVDQAEIQMTEQNILQQAYYHHKNANEESLFRHTMAIPAPPVEAEPMRKQLIIEEDEEEKQPMPWQPKTYRNEDSFFRHTLVRVNANYSQVDPTISIEDDEVAPRSLISFENSNERNLFLASMCEHNSTNHRPWLTEMKEEVPQALEIKEHENENEKNLFQAEPPNPQFAWEQFHLPNMTDDELVNWFLKDYREAFLDVVIINRAVKRKKLQIRLIETRIKQLHLERANALRKYAEIAAKGEYRTRISVEFYASLLDDMDPTYEALFFHLNFIIRRLIAAYLAFAFQSMPMIQLLIFMICGLATMVYLAAFKPFYSKLNDKLELFNEFVILMIVDTYATLLGYYYGVKQLTNFGFLLNFLIGCLLIGNIVTMIYASTDKIKRKIFLLQRWFRKKFPKKKRSLAEEAGLRFATEEDEEAGKQEEAESKVEQRAINRSKVHQYQPNESVIQLMEGDADLTVDAGTDAKLLAPVEKPEMVIKQEAKEESLLRQGLIEPKAADFESKSPGKRKPEKFDKRIITVIAEQRVITTMEVKSPRAGRTLRFQEKKKAKQQALNESINAKLKTLNKLEGIAGLEDLEGKQDSQESQGKPVDEVDSPGERWTPAEERRKKPAKSKGWQANDMIIEEEDIVRTVDIKTEQKVRFEVTHQKSSAKSSQESESDQSSNSGDSAESGQDYQDEQKHGHKHGHGHERRNGKAKHESQGEGHQDGKSQDLDERKKQGMRRERVIKKLMLLKSVMQDEIKVDDSVGMLEDNDLFL